MRQDGQQQLMSMWTCFAVWCPMSQQRLEQMIRLKGKLYDPSTLCPAEGYTIPMHNHEVAVRKICMATQNEVRLVLESGCQRQSR